MFRLHLNGRRTAPLRNKITSIQTLTHSLIHCLAMCVLSKDRGGGVVGGWSLITKNLDASSSSLFQFHCTSKFCTLLLGYNWTSGGGCVCVVPAWGIASAYFALRFTFTFVFGCVFCFPFVPIFFSFSEKPQLLHA